MRRAVKKPDGELILQGLDVQGDGRLGEAKLLGGPVKAEQFGNGAEYLQAWILHKPPIDPIRYKRNCKIITKIHWNATPEGSLTEAGVAMGQKSGSRGGRRRFELLIAD